MTTFLVPTYDDELPTYYDELSTYNDDLPTYDDDLPGFLRDKFGPLVYPEVDVPVAL